MNCHGCKWLDECGRAGAAEAEVSELRKRLAEAEAACAYHKYRRGEANTSTRGLALTAYGLRQKLAEVEAQRDEAVHDRMMMEQRIGELNARAEKAERERDAAIQYMRKTFGWCTGCVHFTGIYGSGCKIGEMSTCGEENNRYVFCKEE